MPIQLSGSLAITGSLVATGQIVAQTLNVQQVTSSIVYSCGSNIFGTSTSNTQTFTGSMFITGSTLTVNGGAICTTGNTCIGGTTVIAGNTGIGTSSPDVFSRGYSGRILGVSSAGQSAIELNGAAGSAAYLDMGINGTRYLGLYTDSVSSDISTIGAYPLTLSINSTPRLLFSSTGIACFACQVCAPVAIFSGCVGIGTTSPVVRLDYGSTTGQAFHLYTSGADYYGINMAQYDSESFSTNIFSGNNGLIKFRTASGTTTQSTRMTIIANGNVGIGTTTPSRALHVLSGAGTVQIQSTGTTSHMYFADANSSVIDNQGFGSVGNNIWFSAGGFERMRITSTGVVGIGTTSPVIDDGNLVVAGCVGTGQGVTCTTAQINIWETTSGNKAGLWFGAVNCANVGVIGSRTATGNIAFQTYCGAWAERMRITYNGNVGIGTTSPGDKLDVVGNISLNAGYKFYNGAANNSAGIDFDSSYVSLSGYNGIRFFASNTGVGSMTQRMFLNSSGNLGIGTTPFSWASGWRALEVGASGVIAYTGAGANDLSYTLNSYFDSADDRWEYRYTGDGATRYSITALTREHRWFNAPVGTTGCPITWTQAMTLDSSGRLGIGTTSPCALLHVTSTSSNSVLWSAILNNPYNDGVSGYGVGLRLQNSSMAGTQEINKWAGIAAIAGGSSGYSNDTDLAFYVGCFILASNCTCPPVEKMRIKSSTGYVGIGTTSPCAVLHVQGTGALQDLLYFCTGGSVNTKFVYSVVSGADDAFVLRRNHTTQGDLCIMSWTYQGYVGIGTTTPTGQFHICGSDPAFRIQSTVSGNMQFGQWDGTNNRIQASGRNFLLQVQDANAMIFATDATERMRIMSNGNIGICTTAAATKLGLNSYVGARLPYINGTNNTFDSNGITVGNLNNGNTNIGGGIDFTNNCYCIGAYSPILSFSSVSSNYAYNNAYAGMWGVFQGAGGDANWNKGDLAFGTSTAYGLTEKMRITSDGKVLVGTTNSDIGGSVAGVAITNDGRVLASICCTGTLCHVFMGDRRGTSSEGPVLMMARGGFFKATVGVLGAADSLNNGGLTFSTVSGNDTINERMRITNTGAVGIGTTSTSAEANLFLGAKSAVEGGQMVFQKGTSCSCATHLDNYNDSFRVLVGDDTGSNGIHMLIDHKTKNACFYGTIIQSPSVISNNNAPFGAQVNGGYKYFGGTLANGEKFGSQGGTYVQGFYLISWFDGASGRGYGLFATVQPAANAGTILISSGGVYAVSATYNASNAVSLAFDGSSRGAVLSNNTGVGLTFYAYVFGGV